MRRDSVAVKYIARTPAATFAVTRAVENVALKELVAVGKTRIFIANFVALDPAHFHHFFALLCFI